jgi:polysaccharide pyruvyl transferase WcaK-like protein
MEDGVPLTFTFNGQKFSVEKKNIGFRRNLFKTQNAYTLLGYALLTKVIPSYWLKNKLKARNPYFKEIMETDLTFDITAGDSFSDIYGMRIFKRHSLMKWLFILCGNKFVMLPQTYGPFKSRFSKIVARYLLTRTTAIYARDMAGVKCVKRILGKVADQKMIRFIPDVAFVLDPEKPQSVIIEQLENLKAKGHVLVGLNVSGIIYHAEYQAVNKFGLKCDYQKLINDIVKSLMVYPNTVVVLVPHVFVKTGHLESDPDACSKVYQQMVDEYHDRILLVEEVFNHKQIKYLIGCCDFFMGTRMHACIAALSQYVPAVGLAYSDKFVGVFESVGVGDLIADLRTENEQILACVQDTFNKRTEIAEKLHVTISSAQKRVLGLFDDL